MELSILVLQWIHLCNESHDKPIQKIGLLDFDKTYFDKFKYYDVILFNNGVNGIKILKNTNSLINITLDNA